MRLEDMSFTDYLMAEFDLRERQRKERMKQAEFENYAKEHNLFICTKNILVQIREEIEQIADEEQKHDEKWAMGLRYAVKIIDKYAEQEPCDDVVSRQAVLDLIEHYNSDGLGSVFYGYEQGVKFADAVNKLPSVRPQEPEIVKYGWTKIPKCTTCKYWYSPIVPCSRCKDNSEFKPQESDEISERNMKMWEEIFKAESEVRKKG